MPTQSDRSVTIRMGEALQLRLDIDAIENRRTTAESLMALLCDALRDQPFNLTQCWSTHRSRVTHLYVPGHGTGDSALCGAVFDGNRRLVTFGDPECGRCATLRERMVKL
ncbi:MAG: hypothetical protein KTQ12_03625 [Dermatophilaceae bacterium]|jgi:hypothetical protein|nr:hypothetical protein [Dermatophilaceae bacterium]